MTQHEAQDNLNRPVTHGDLVLLNERLEAIQKSLKEMAPHGDIDGHRKYHEALIEAQKRRVKIYDAIIEKTLTALLWAAIVAVCVAVWHEFQDRVTSRQGTTERSSHK
jgi:hypothetical protein